MSKATKIIISIILVLNLLYFGQKLVMHHQFSNYLNDKYPGHEFKVHWISNRLLVDFPNSIKPYVKTFSMVNCGDGTEFTVSRSHKKTTDNYLVRLHDTIWQQEFHSLFEGKSFIKYVDAINTLVFDKDKVFEANGQVDYAGLPQMVDVYLNEEAIKDDKHRSEIIYGIAGVLNENNINVQMLSNYFSRDGGEYCLEMDHEDLGETAEDIEAMIEKKK